MPLEKVADSLHRCISCGECDSIGPYIPYIDAYQVVEKWTCPILDRYKFHAYSARGLVFLAREIYYKDMAIDADVAQVFYACTTCGTCDEICPLPILEIVKNMREDIARLHPELVPEPNQQRNEKIRSKLNIFGAPNQNRAKWAEGLNLPQTGSTMLFTGCYSSFRQPESARSAVKVLRHLGLEVGYLGDQEKCCGQHCGWSGDPKLQKELAQQIVPALAAAGATQVVFICPSCYRTFKRDYQEALGDLPFDLIHIAELVDQQLSRGTVKFTKQIDEFVTYHDPCHLSRQHLGRRQAVYDQPRNILHSIPGLKFAEISPNKKFALCCGNGALVTEPAFPEIAANMSSHIFAAVNQLKEASLPTLLTSCPHCHETLTNQSRRAKQGIKVKNLVDLMAEAL
jgi:Fe-S oxidoreductase